MLEAVTLAGNAEQVREEVAELRQLAMQARTVEATGTEAKLARLEDLLRNEGFFDRPDKRLLVFTEFRDTLDHLVGRLKDWGFAVGSIHGGMKPGSRDEPGTRLHSEQRFREGAIQVLVATEAAGEGINLQVCNVLFNYDIPWNPNRLEQRMGRIHRYGQREDCLIFNFAATNTIEGQVLRRLLDKLQEIRDALDDDAVFNVVGEVLPAAYVERILRDYYAGKLGDADLEDRLLESVDEGRFRNICRNALEGLASKKLNLDMLIERRARAQERRVVPETIARFLAEAARYVPFKLAWSKTVSHPPAAPAGDDRDSAQRNRQAPAPAVASHANHANHASGLRPYPRSPLKAAGSAPHTFEPGRTPAVLRRYERDPDWKLPALADRYPRCSTDRETAEKHALEWVTPGHPLFEAVRRHTCAEAAGVFGTGASFHSLQHAHPARIDFYRARIVDGLGQTIHERLFAVETDHRGERHLREPGLIGNFVPAEAPEALPEVATAPEPAAWLHRHALAPFLEDTRRERLTEIGRVASHVELSLTELLQRADEEIGKADEDRDHGVPGAEGRLARAEHRHAELLARRERRARELEGQRSLTLQGVERLTSVLVLPHPEREAPDLRHMRPNLETEATAMRVVMEHERAQGRQVYDVSEKNLGYDVTSLDLDSGELRLIEVKGLAGATGTILLTPNERRVAEDRRDCYWLYVVTGCAGAPTLQDPIPDPARFDWNEVTKVAHYYLSVNALTRPMQVREDAPSYGDGGRLP